MEAYLFTLCPLQNSLQPFSDSSRISWGFIIDWGREYPFGAYDFLMCLEDIQDRGWENDASVSRFGFGRRDHQFPFDPVNLPFYPEFPSAEVEVAPLEGANLTPAEPGG